MSVMAVVVKILYDALFRGSVENGMVFVYWDGAVGYDDKVT
jgi:hypothetical protein